MGLAGNDSGKSGMGFRFFFFFFSFFFLFFLELITAFKRKSRAMQNQKLNLLTSRMIAWLAIVDGKIELPDRGFNSVEPQLNPAEKKSSSFKIQFKLVSF